MKKRMISLLMALAMSLTLLPATSYAAEESGTAIGAGRLCEHHTAHDDACGYVEGIEESPCTHEHGAECYTEVTSCIHEHTQDCYPVSDSSDASGVMASDAGNDEDTMPSDTQSDEEAMPSDTKADEGAAASGNEPGESAASSEAAEPTECSHVCSVESGCIKQELDCHHEHNEECGYAPAVEGQPCTYVCTLCGMTEITAWSWVDAQDAIDPDSGVLALSASADSPALYEDIVNLLPTEIEATTEDGTETLSLDSWSCDDYPAEGAYTGSYAFHAVLPEGYGLAADAPALTVTVELDGAVTLADGTGTEHTNHPICGASCLHNGTHSENVTWTEWKGNSIKFNEQGIAYVYLNEDIVLDNRWYTRDDATVYLCLNGHTITSNESYYNAAVIISENSNLIFCDCKGGGELQIGTVNSHELYGIDVGSDCNMTMYGGTIRGFNKSGVNVYGSFNMYGGNITNNSSSDNYSGGVRINSGATFDMYGGAINDNKGGYFGGGVYNKGTFRMHSGSISGNTGGCYGGGVYNNGTFEMSGGSVTGNTVSKSSNRYGCGVYCNSNSIIKLSGAPVINNNTRAATFSPINDNLLLYDNDSTITISGALTSGAHIGVNVGLDKPTANNPRAITSGSNADYSSYFSSDDSYYIIVDSVSGGEHIVQLAVPGISHTHDWEYTKKKNDDSTVYVSCKSTTGTCDYQTKPATVKISTAQTTYDSETITEAPKAVLTYSNWPDGLAKFQEYAIEYYKSADGGSTYTVLVTDNNDLKKPGKYVAQLDYVRGSKYLVTYFSVVDNSKKDPNYTAPTAIPGLTYNGRELILINQGHTEGGQMQYRLDGGTYSTTLPTATNAGTYTVYYKVVGDASHNDTAEESITVTIGKAPLTGAPTFTPVTEAGKTIDDVTLTASIGWPAGTFHWMNGEIGLNGATPITQGTPYHWVFIPADKDNYQSIGGSIVLWAKGSDAPGQGSTEGGGTSGGNNSNTGDSNSSDTGAGNGTSSGNTTGATSAVIVTVPVSGSEKSIQVNARISGTTANIENVDLSKLETVIGDDVKTGVVTISFSGLNKKVDTVKLPANVVKQIAEAVNDPDNDAESLEIVLSDGSSIEFDAKTLGDKIAQVDGVDITISIRYIDAGTMNNLQQQAVGSRPALEIIVTSGGRPISDMGGRITMYAPYELGLGEQAGGVVVYYVDGNGSRQLCETSYDPIKKQVSWVTTHLSIYMIGYDESRVNPAGNPQENQTAGDSNASCVTYIVQKGNTLWAIAKKYGCTISELVAANSDLIKNPNRIYAGWQLKIPQD